MNEFLYSDKWFLAQRKSLVRANRRHDWKDAPLWLRVVWIVAIVNFASFCIIAFLNGGDALNGKEEVGKYFLGGRGHYTEVSKAFFQYSAIHSYSVFVTHSLAIFGSLAFVRKKATPT
jgi:hypothetical protein